MILQKEFYFIRHGQTDHNLLEGKNKGDHPSDIPLNTTGKNQAKLVEPIISALPIKTVCSSPFKRAQETKEIITSNLEVHHYEVSDLGECSAQMWREMSQYGMYSPLPTAGLAHEFIDQVRNGLNQALSLPAPSLIVAHGGVHWAICCLIGIQAHEWTINNCIPVHFSVGADGIWIAKKLL